MEEETTWQKHIESAIDRQLECRGVHSETIAELRAKREKGREKYGDNAYQASFEAFLATDFCQHGNKEVLDLMNYLVIYKLWLAMHGIDDYRRERIYRMIKYANEIIELFDGLED